MKIISASDSRLASKQRIDLIGAIAAGVCAGAARSGFNALNHDPSLWAIIRWTIIAIAAYFVVAKLLQFFLMDSQKRTFPRWLLTAFAGSIVYVAALFMPTVIAGWYDPYRVEGSLTEYVLVELNSAKFPVLLFSLITLPILGVFHYFEQIRKAVRGWHSGSPPPRIIN